MGASNLYFMGIFLLTSAQQNSASDCNALALLRDTAWHGNLKRCLHLLRKIQIDPNDPVDEQGSSLLFYAVSSGNVVLAALLIGRGACVNHKNRLGEAPLIKAAWKQSPAMVRLLLDVGADPEVIDHSNVTPLLAAASLGNHQMVRELTRAGGAMNAVSVVFTEGTAEYATPLLFATLEGNEAVIRELMIRGAEPLSVQVLEDWRSAQLQRQGSIQEIRQRLQQMQVKRNVGLEIVALSLDEGQSLLLRDLRRIVFAFAGLPGV